jgi:hypothetical protein
MNTIYTVTECYSEDGTISLNVSHAYTNLDAAKKHLQKQFNELKPGYVEDYGENLNIAEDEMFCQLDGDKDNWCHIEINVQEVKDHYITDEPDQDTDSNILFSICEYDVQCKAEEKIGRRLTDSEMHSVKKGIEWGLNDVQWDVISAAIDEAAETDTEDEDEDEEEDE